MNEITINHYIKNIIDKSWYAYISFIYEDNNTINSSLSSSFLSTQTNIMELIKKHDINFYYQNAPIKILPIDWPKSISFLSNLVHIIVVLM